jgi:hydroxypyruvate reductase
MNDSARDHALAIWQAGVAAVRSDRLVADCVRVQRGELHVGPHRWPLAAIGRIEVVGAGKAGAGMAAGLEAALGQRWLEAKRVDGWINVPADCVRPLARIHLHAARPAGRNEPSAEGVRGADEILRRVASLQPADLCICLISGGGSALLPAPRPGIDWQDLQQVTQELSAAGATIEQLNAVRKQLSLIQGGRLARACRAGRLITLIISDVMGDPLDVIGSGPTVVADDPRKAARRALDVLDHFEQLGARFSPVVRALLTADLQGPPPPPVSTQVTHLVIGNNAAATRAAGDEALRRGFDTRWAPPQPAQTTAEEAGRELVELLRTRAAAHDDGGAWCWISGGEPVVKLVPSGQRGRGGRNQQLVLAALCRLLECQPPDRVLAGQAILSGGTDGEDGPTDAAGAVVDQDVVRRMLARQLDPTHYLQRNDAYTFFAATGGLIRTGPTHTNVCDVRVIVGMTPEP